MAEPIDLTRGPRFVLRDPSRRPWARLMARGLIQLLLVGMLPVEWQLRGALWPAFAILAVQGLERRLTGLAPAEGGPVAPDAVAAERPAVHVDLCRPVGSGASGAPGEGKKEGDERLSVEAQRRGAAATTLSWSSPARRTEHGVGSDTHGSRSGHGWLVAVPRDTGSAWIAGGSPGRADYAEFYGAVARAGLFFMDPRTVKAQPGQSKGLVALYRAVAQKGVPYSLDLTVTHERVPAQGDAVLHGQPLPEGPPSQPLVSASTTAVTKVSTDPIPDSLFEVPAGYTLVAVGR